MMMKKSSQYFTIRTVKKQQQKNHELCRGAFTWPGWRKKRLCSKSSRLIRSLGKRSWLYKALHFDIFWLKPSGQSLKNKAGKSADSHPGSFPMRGRGHLEHEQTQDGGREEEEGGGGGRSCWGGTKLLWLSPAWGWTGPIWSLQDEWRLAQCAIVHSQSRYILGSQKFLTLLWFVYNVLFKIITL